MEVPLLVHDELLHKLDEPYEQHIAQMLKNATHVTKIVPAPANEATALLPPKELLVVDMSEVEAILNTEEREAIAADARLTTWEIVQTEAKALTAIVVPMLMFVMLETLPPLALNMMVGHTDPSSSTQILAAFSLEGLFEAVLIAGMTDGFAAGIDTLCSQAFGGKRLVELWLFVQAGLLSYALCLPFVTAILLFGSDLLKAAGQNPAIADISGNILIATSIGFPFAVLTSVMKSSLQAQNVVFPFALASLIAWTLTCATAYLLAFHTSMGYMGIAISPALCWALKASLLLPAVLRNKVFLESWPGWKLQQAFKLVPKVIKLGISGVLMVMFQMLGYCVITLIAGILPRADIAITANGILGSILVLSFPPFVALNVSGAIRIGNSLGAGLSRRAKIISRIVMATSLTIALVFMSIVPLITNAIARGYTPNQDAINATTNLVNHVLPLIPLISLMFSMQSIFRGCGKQLLCAIINFVCTFMIGIPVGVFLALKWDEDLVGLWTGNMIGLFLMTVVGFAWLARTSWTKLAHEAKHNLKLHDGERPH